MCIAGAVVESWSLTQKVAGSSSFTVMTNIFVTEFTDFAKMTTIFGPFRWRGNNSQNRIENFQSFCQKLHENERIWTPRGGGPSSIAPRPLGSDIELSFLVI